jgi:regulator of protease activity HflC (stomatin/prohibitin superfamily)
MNRHLSRSLAAAAVLLFVLYRSLAVIPAGHVGVVDLFGRVSEHALEPGLRLVNPLARVVRMSVQTQELKETMEVPSREGLTMALDVSILFHLEPARAPEVYRSVGLAWVPVLLEPQFRSVVRGVTAAFESRALYTAEREQLAETISREVSALVASRGVVVESTPLRKMTLPKRVAAAIEEKLSAEQESQRMQFILAKEKQEAERKRIEAQGIADFQRIVSQGISEPLLRWKGIEATTRLAESANTKVVVVGSGKDGLPLILGGN